MAPSHRPMNDLPAHRRAGTCARLLGLCTAALLGMPAITAWAENLEPYRLGEKQVVEVKAKAMVGPSVRVDERGAVALAWMEDDKDLRSVVFARGTGQGQGIGPTVRVTRAEDSVYWRQEAPALVVEGAEVFVSWARTHPQAGPQQPFATELRLSRSIDGGRTFLPSVLVNDDPGVIQHTFDALHRTADGRLHLSWIDAREGKKESGTFVTRSHDAGATVMTNLKVDEGTCVCCRTALTSGPDGALYVAWRKIFEGNIRETVVARSTDGGVTFDPAVIVGHDRWVFPGCPHRPASLGVDGTGRLYAVWYTEGTDETPAIYIAHSDDRGQTFSGKRQLNVAKNTFPDHPQLAVDAEGRVVVVWEEQAPVKRDVVVSVSTDRGQTYTAPRKVNERKSQTPSVATNTGGQFALAWMEHGMPGHKIVVQPLDIRQAPRTAHAEVLP